MEHETEPSYSAFFDVDVFFDHVYNAAYDIFEDSFDTFEENVPLLLDNATEEKMKAITVGFDSVFNTIQEKLEKNLNRWEEYCRANCFVNLKDVPKYQEDDRPFSADADCKLQTQEENLDTELESTRNQLHAAGKESARLRREVRNLERFLAMKQKREAALHDAVTQLKDKSNHDMLEELVKVASLLQEKLKKVKPERVKSPRGVRQMGVGRADVDMALADVDMASLESIARTLAL